MASRLWTINNLWSSDLKERLWNGIIQITFLKSHFFPLLFFSNPFSNVRMFVWCHSLWNKSRMGTGAGRRLVIHNFLSMVPPLLLWSDLAGLFFIVRRVIPWMEVFFLSLKWRGSEKEPLNAIVPRDSVVGSYDLVFFTGRQTKTLEKCFIHKSKFCVWGWSEHSGLFASRLTESFEQFFFVLLTLSWSSWAWFWTCHMGSSCKHAKSITLTQKPI